METPLYSHNSISNKNETSTLASTYTVYHNYNNDNVSTDKQNSSSIRRPTTATVLSLKKNIPPYFFFSFFLLPRVALLVVPAPRHCVNWAAPSPARHEGGDVSRARNPEKS